MWGRGMIKGLGITLRNLLRGPITVKYPYEKLELPERARWAVAPKYDEAGDPKCTACLACVRACPDYVLDLEVVTREDKSKHIKHYHYELGACMMCGLCVEACPFDAIEMSQDYELAVTDPSQLAYDLLTDVDAASPRRDRPAKPMPAPAKPTPAPESDAPASGPAPDVAAPDEGGAEDG